MRNFGAAADSYKITASLCRNVQLRSRSPVVVTSMFMSPGRCSGRRRRDSLGTISVRDILSVCTEPAAFVIFNTIYFSVHVKNILGDHDIEVIFGYNYVI